VTEELEPAAYLFKHDFIVNTNRSDRKITGSAPLTFDHEKISDPEPLFAASDIVQHLELNELINQLAIAHRELQSLKDGGIDDKDLLDQRIEANQRLQKKIEDFRESSQEVED